MLVINSAVKEQLEKWYATIETKTTSKKKKKQREKREREEDKQNVQGALYDQREYVGPFSFKLLHVYPIIVAYPVFGNHQTSIYANSLKKYKDCVG